MATIITLYKTQLSPYDIDRPNDMATYLSTCDSETVQSTRDMRFENLQEIEIMTSAVSSFDLMDCNYLEIVNAQISSKKWRYFVLGAAYSKANVATLSLKVDPWGCACDWAGELMIELSSFVKRAPKVYEPQSSAVIPNLVRYQKGSTMGMIIHYRAGGTAYNNSFDGRGVPVVFAEVTDNLASTSKDYPVAFFSPTVYGDYRNTTLNDQFQFLIDCIKFLNAKGTYTMTIELSSGGQVTLNNAKVKQITSAYIVPSYALAGLYGSAVYWERFSLIEEGGFSIFYDSDPLNRHYEQFIGEKRTPTSYTSGRIMDDVSPLYIGNSREAVQVKRSNYYNGARLSWAMGSDGFTLTVHEIADTLEAHDLTNAIAVPNVKTSFFNVTTTTETEKTLNRVSSGVAVLGGVAAVVGGIASENPVAVVAGAGTIARAASGAIDQEKRYRGEGANGFIAPGAGVDFSPYYRLVYSNATDDTPPRTFDRAIPIISAFTVYTVEAYELSKYYTMNGVPVGDIPAPLTSIISQTSGFFNLLTIIAEDSAGVYRRANFWLFDTVSIHVTGGIYPFVRELAEMLKTTGVRVWDTSTAALSANFKV